MALNTTIPMSLSCHCYKEEASENSVKLIQDQRGRTGVELSRIWRCNTYQMLELYCDILRYCEEGDVSLHSPENFVFTRAICDHVFLSQLCQLRVS